MVDLVVIGAGPAGMAGALAAAECGLEVVVVDEQAAAGGQIFRRTPESFGGSRATRPYRWAPDLIARFDAHPNIRVLYRSTAFGIMRDREGGAVRLNVGVSTATGGELIPAKRILIATGSYDLPVAFPGWTKPGVMTVGAAQTLLKSQKVLAGRRVILAGSHPLLLIAADQLLQAGAEITEIAFARGLPRAREMGAALSAAPGHFEIFAEAGRAAARVVSRGVKVTTRTIVTAATGVAAVTGARLTRVDPAWHRVGPEREVSGDLLLLGYGFSPATDLARQAGCQMRWNSRLGGWTVVTDERFASTAADIFVAGEPTGVAGAEQSRAEGRIAGLHIAESLGSSASDHPRLLRRAHRALSSSGRFSAVVQAMFEPNREALGHLSDPEGTTVCRCELVDSGALDTALRANPFISTANAAKLECRSGMGPCQGRYCEGTVASRVAAARGIAVADAGYFTAHVPVKPVPLSTYRSLGS